MFCEVRNVLCFELIFVVMGLGRVIEEACAEAFVATVALQDIEVHTAFAAFPECSIGCEPVSYTHLTLPTILRV